MCGYHHIHFLCTYITMMLTGPSPMLGIGGTCAVGGGILTSYNKINSPSTACSCKRLLLGSSHSKQKMRLDLRSNPFRKRAIEEPSGEKEKEYIQHL